MNFVKCRSRETCDSREVRKEHKQETKAADAMDEVEKAPVPLVTQVNNILHSVFSNIKVYIDNQQSYTSNGLPAYKPYICNNFKEAISKNKGVLYCKGYDYEEEFPDEIMETPLSEPFFTRRVKIFSKHDDSMLYGKPGLTSSPPLNCYSQNRKSCHV